MALAQDIQQATRLYGISRRMADVRDEYYLHLERAQKGDMNVTEWLCWFIGQFRLACVNSSRILDRSLEKAQFWAAHAGKSLSDAQRKAVTTMLDAGPQGFDGGMSTRKYGNLTRVSPATASRDLGALARLGLFTVTGQGKSTRYWINIEGWEKGEGIEK